MFIKGIEVKLIDDLTYYHPKLVIGTIGITTDIVSPISAGHRSIYRSDVFIGVIFPDISIDVLWKSLEIIDERLLDGLSKARNVIKYVGPKGGFRMLSFEYLSGVNFKKIESSYYNKQLISIFEKNNIPIEIRSYSLKEVHDGSNQ